MTHTVAIPDCIVGDTPTLERRRAEADSRLVVLAICVADRLAESGDPGPYFTRELVEAAAEYRALSAELSRRTAAYWLAREPRPMVAA